MASIKHTDNILNNFRKSAKEFIQKYPDKTEYIRGYEDAIAELEYELDNAEPTPDAVFTVKLDTAGLKETLEESVSPLKKAVEDFFALSEKASEKEESTTSVSYKAMKDFTNVKQAAEDLFNLKLAPEEEVGESVKTLIDSFDLDKIKLGPDSLKDLFKNLEDSVRESENVTTEEAAEANGVGSFEKLFNASFAPHGGFADKPRRDYRDDEYDPRGKDEIDAHNASAENGFWDDLIDDIHSDAFLVYIGNKLLLLVGEVIEAHEEIRNGRRVDEIYYPTNTEDPTAFRDSTGKLHKPEGFLVELADLSIRLDDLVGFLHLNVGTPHLWEIKEEKRIYNRSRGHKHGKKF